MINNLDRNKKYTITTKYPSELGAIHKNLKLVCIIYDYRVATMISDVASQHRRLQQIDRTIPPIKNLTYLVFRDDKDKFNTIAMEYIDDVILSDDSDIV